MTATFVDDLNGRPLVIYGAGSGFHWFFESLYLKHGIKPRLVIDRRFAAVDEFHGFAASNCAEALPLPMRRDCLVLVAISDMSIAQSVEALLVSWGFSDIRSLFSVYDLFAPFDPSAQSTICREIASQADKISLVASLLADECSCSLFDQILNVHQTGIVQRLASRPEAEQYFAADLPIVLDRSHVLFGGIDVDMQRMDQLRDLGVERAHFVEADEDVRALFLKEIGRTSVNIPLVLVPAALHSSTQLVHFDSANAPEKLAGRGYPTGYGSRISTSGEHIVQGLALDDLFVADSPTLMCLDIEGSELDALRGAQRLLTTHTPDLAICVYHKAADVWEIPLFLHQLDVGYSFYLRNYTGWGAETVLYASVKSPTANSFTEASHVVL